MRFCLRKFLQEHLQLTRQGRRPEWLRQNANSCASASLLRLQDDIEIAQEIVPSADVFAVHDGLGAIGIVKIEKVGLRPNGSRAEAGGMVGIAFDFNRPAFAAFYDDSLRVAVECGCAAEVQRFSGYDLRGFFYVRHNFFDGLFRTGAEACQRKRSGAQAYEFATAKVVRPFAGARQKFVRRMVGTARRTIRRARRSRSTIFLHFPHRWQVLQFVRRPLVSMWYRPTSLALSAF